MKDSLFFGLGDLYKVGDDALATPGRFGTLQDVSVDFSWNEKELQGQSGFPEAVARGAAKISGKATSGRVNGQLFNELFFDGDIADGRTLIARNEAATPEAATFTVNVANAAKFDTDLGVRNAATGAPYLKVAAGSEAAGAYSVDPATGVYTFSDQTPVLIDYSYADDTGSTLTLNNKLQGPAPTFKLILRDEYEGEQSVMTLFACSSSKLSLPKKNEDFVMPEIDFAARADAAGRVMTWSFA
ncbi:MAG TPA: hypothetical protein VFM97_09535 [Gammaproteobacteria bacterium]|nr:hypothetical protein [Gammaproteobacteria bacterium]